MPPARKRLFAAAAGIAALLGAWWLLSLAVRQGFVPGPATVIARMFVLLGGGLAGHAGASLARIGAAMALALATAVPAGIALGRSRRIDAAFAPVVYLLYPVPKIALLPIIMLLFGIGNGARVAIVALILFFQVLVSTRDAARKVPAQYLLSLRSLGASRRHALQFVIIPAILPEMLSSLRVGTGTALAVLFFSETFGTRRGLGYFVIESWMRLSYVDMFAGVLCLGLCGLLLFLGIDVLERRLCRWKARAT
jgi:NitT/TauT family transport system permease protein